jgi:UDP-N-acetylmuramoyl-tripeptide--D-alanyl-D-alanine ligase
MRYKLRHLRMMARTPLGRMQIADGMWRRSWPLLRSAACIYRRLLLRRTRLIVISGTYGKTTTAHAVRAALGLPHDPRVSQNFLSSVARALLRISPFAAYGVIEAGIDGPGQMQLYTSMLLPDTAIITSIGTEHHRRTGSIENTRNEKAQLLSRLTPEGLAIINGDDPHVRWMGGQTRGRVIFYGMGEGNHVRANRIEAKWPEGTAFHVEVDDRAVPVFSPLHGRHMIYPMLAAMAVAHCERMDLSLVAERLRNFRPIYGRMQVVNLPDGVTLICDDFKSSLETVESALDTLAAVPARRRIVVLGEIAELPASQGTVYRALGARLAAGCERAYIVGKNFQRYASGAARAGMPRSSLIDCGSFPINVLERLRQDLQEGDVVLIKGRYTQRLGRVALALQGHPVGCWISSCNCRSCNCDSCPMLATGWGNHPVIV